MHQLTLRISDDLADRLKHAAAGRGDSVNAYATSVLGAAVDPELAGDEIERVRERLGRAGLLALRTPSRRGRPDASELAEARQRAGRGQPLSDLVSEGRR